MSLREPKTPPTGGAGVAANIAWSAASRAVQAAAGFGAAVVVARHLGLAELGEYFGALAVAGAALSPSYCGIQQYLVREAGRGDGAAGALLGAGLVLRLALVGLAGLGLALWAALAQPGARTGPAVLAVAFGAEAFRSLGQLAGAVFQTRERMRPEFVLTLVHSLLWGALLCAAVAVQGGVVAMLGATCAALAGHCLLSWAVAARSFLRPRLAAGLEHVAPMLRGALVIGLSAVVVQNLFRVNVLVLERLGTAEDVAFFQTSNEFVLRLQVVFLAVMLAAYPALSRLLAGARDQASELTVALGRLMTAAACALALALGVFAEPILTLFYGAKMLPAAACFRVLALGTAPLALGMLWAQVLVAGHRQRQALAASALALAINLALSLALTPAHGVAGASAAALAAYAASALGALWAAHRLLGGSLAELACLRCLAAFAGGLLLWGLAPQPWAGPAGLGAYVLLLGLLRGAGLGELRVLMRCARPDDRP